MQSHELNETEVRTQLITPALMSAGWDFGREVREEFQIAAGRIDVRGELATRRKPSQADYVLFLKPNIPLAVVEAKDAKHPVDAPSDSDEQSGAKSEGPTPRTTTTIQRVARSTGVSNAVKRLHRHTCQVCGEVIGTPGGPYAEGAHIIPLGFPHNGPDVEENVLCLCPNDHVRFDTGAIWLDDDLVIVDAATGRRTTSLRQVQGHSLRPDCVEYHRSMWQES